MGSKGLIIGRFLKTGFTSEKGLGLYLKHKDLVEGFWVIKCHHVGNVRKRPISSGSGQ